MNDTTIEMPDHMAAAATAELDAIQHRLEATWDIEAGLREILLEEHYHRFVEERAGRLDVEASLAEVLVGSDAEDLRNAVAALKVDLRRLKSTLDAISVGYGKVEVSAGPNTFDRVRLLAREVDRTLDAVWADHRKLIRANAVDRRCANDLVKVQRQADHWLPYLALLGDQLEQGVVGLGTALGTVRNTALLLMSVYDVISTIWYPRSKRRGHPFAPKVLDLAVDVNLLEQPIKRLFDPSDDVVDVLL